MPMDKLTPELRRIVSTGQAIELLAKGYLDSEGLL